MMFRVYPSHQNFMSWMTYCSQLPIASPHPYQPHQCCVFMELFGAPGDFVYLIPRGHFTNKFLQALCGFLGLSKTENLQLAWQYELFFYRITSLLSSIFWFCPWTLQLLFSQAVRLKKSFTSAHWVALSLSSRPLSPRKISRSARSTRAFGARWFRLSLELGRNN